MGHTQASLRVLGYSATSEPMVISSVACPPPLILLNDFFSSKPFTCDFQHPGDESGLLIAKLFSQF